MFVEYGSDPRMSQETEFNNEEEWEKDIHEREDELSTLRQQADAAAAKIQALKKLGPMKSKYGQQNYPIEKDVMEEIEEIITKRTTRYPNWEKFVDESLKNTITFWQRPEEMESIGGKLWKDMTVQMKSEIKKKAAPFYYYMDEKFGLHNKVATTVSEIHQARTRLSNVKFQKPENILYGYYDPEKKTYQTNVIHETYNRFFPLKLLVTTLASMIHKKIDIPGNTEWIDYEEFEKEALEFAQEISNKLKKINPKAGRGDRISTGLPIGFPHNQSPDKIEASNERFLKCFVGHKGAPQVFEGISVQRGALNETGLVYLRNNNGKLEITLSEDGFEFFKFENPVIKNIIIIKDTNAKSPTFDKPTGIDFNRNADGVIEKIFSEDERKFIGNKIIPKFTLEKQIIDDIVTKIKKDGKVKAEVLDDVVEDSIIEWKKDNQDIAEKQKIDEKNKDVYRIATMGRLAEIGIVNWEIEEGISFYSINK